MSQYRVPIGTMSQLGHQNPPKSPDWDNNCPNSDVPIGTPSYPEIPHVPIGTIIVP